MNKAIIMSNKNTPKPAFFIKPFLHNTPALFAAKYTLPLALSLKHHLITVST